MENKNGINPNEVGSIEPIPIYERTPFMDMLPNNLRNAMEGIGGLMDDPMIAMPGGLARMPLKKLLQELAQRKALYKQHGERYRRAAQVKQSAIRDGYNPDIVGSEKIMNNANNIGKKLKKEMDELQNLISKNGNT